MNGGLTYKDMDTRKEDSEFVNYMRKKNPMTLKMYWEQWKADLIRAGESKQSLEGLCQIQIPR